MTAAAPTYDLVLLLDPQAEDVARAKIVADARAAIEAQGELLRHDEWGNRTLTYPINRKTVAEYHMMQFHASSADLLRQLNRSLRLADEAIRFRIVKLKAGVPDPPDMRSSVDPLRAAASSSATPAEPTPAEPATAEPAPAGEAPAAETATAQAPPAQAPADEPPVDEANAPAAEARAAEAPAGEPTEPTAAAEAEPAAAEAEPAEPSAE